MANLRFFNVNGVIRNITVAKHGSLGIILRRQKHLLFQSGLVSETYPKSRKLLAGLQNPHRYSVLYRLEHGSASASTTVTKTNSSSSVTSLNAKETTTNNSVQSSEAAGSINELSLPPIPEIEECTLVVAEDNFHSLGLGGWSPIGLVQEGLQFFHFTCNLPWWGSILVVTLALKILLLPFQIKGKRLMNEYTNKMPEYQRLKAKADEAKLGGNYYEAAVALQECHNYATENNMMDKKKLFYTLLNVPVFCSCFFALRQMTNTPGLSSFQTGGLFWFTDLTVPDQYYLLPVISGLTTYILIRTNVNPASNNVFLKSSKYTVPILVVFFMSKFPAAILCFSVISNGLALCQNGLLSWDPVRKYFKIPNLVETQPQTKSKRKSRGIIEDIKTTFHDYKVLNEINDRERLNAIKFEESSSSPMKRTFKYNPTQTRAFLQKEEKK